MPEGFVVAVTSAGDAEGKSTIAANLAWLLAGVGHEVVLIDADLRHPSLSRLLRQHPGRGLSSGASGDIADLLQSTRMSTLSFIPAGVPSRHPAEVISTALPRVLQALRGPDRIVIVDAPPLGSVAETATIASITGSAVLVIDTRQRDPDEIEHAVLELQDRHASLFGIVLNRVREKRSTSPYTLAQPMITNGAAAFRPMVTSAGADDADLETEETGPGRSSD